MKIEIRLFATLREGRGKVLKLDVKEDATVREIIKRLEIEQDNIALLLVNGKDGKFDKILNDGDVLSLFPPVGGG